MPNALPRRLLALLLGLSFLAACGGSRPANVIVITIDTLRADRLGCYGYERPTTPNLDALAQESLLFEHAYSQAPFTAPSHASLFTGLHAQSHGVLYWGDKLSPDAKTYAERFAAAGYRTAAFYNHPGMKPCDLERGFEHAELRISEPAEPTIESFLAWLDGESAKPAAAWIHLWDVHRPYGWRDWRELPQELKPLVQRRELTFAYEENRFGPPHDPSLGRGEQYYNLAPARRAQPFRIDGSPRVLDAQDYAYLSDRYDGGVWYADQAIGRLIAELRRRGRLDDTLIVITADHGEALTEREPCYFTHDPFLYDEVLHVPLLIRLPKGELGHQRLPELARGIDILPTLLEFADLPAADIQGRSLLPLARRESLPPALLYAQTQSRSAKESDRRVPKDDPAWVEHRACLFDGRYKLLIDFESHSEALFDLATDPHERTDLHADPAHAAELHRLHQALPAFDSLPKAQRTGGIDDNLQKMLESLGYAGSSPAPQPKSP